MFLRCLLVLLSLVLLSGCMSMRFKTDMEPSAHDVSRWGGMKFRIAEIDSSGLRLPASGTASPHLIKADHGAAWDLADVRTTLANAYPGLFSGDATAIPLRLVINGEGGDNMPFGPMLTGFTLGVIPFPDKTFLKATVRAEVMLPGGHSVPMPVQTSFTNQRVMNMSLVGPLGTMMMAGPSDAPRRGMFLFIPLTSGVYSKESPSQDLARRAMAESVMRALDSLDPASLADVRQSQQRQQRTADIDGRRFYLVTRYGPARPDGKDIDTTFVDVHDQPPTGATTPAASVAVATRDAGGRWTLRRALVHIGDEDYLASAMLEKGIPVVPVMQRTELQLADLLPVASTLDGVRWSNGRLLRLKNERWSGQVQAMTTEQVADHITRIETVIMEHSASVERANDAAQDALAQQKDPREPREWAIVLRQRIEILKALLVPLKTR